MTSPNAPDAAQILARVYRLATAAFRSPSRRVLSFRIVNDTVQVVLYERASLWAISRRRPRLLGVSGQVEIRPRTKVGRSWTRLVEAIPDREKPSLLAKDAFAARAADWAAVVGERHALWLPIPGERRPEVGLWLERPAAWREEEKNVLVALADGYAAAWDRHRPGRLRRALGGDVGRLAGVALAAGVLALGAWGLFVPRVRLKVIAPCEVAPLEPYLVTAPLQGVVESLAVRSGQPVEAGDLLFAYDPRAARQDLEVAEQSVRVLESQLDRATVLALQERQTPDELRVIENRLGEERARLALAREIADRLVVRAPVRGVVQVADPESWRGKPVQVGERVLVLVDPARTQVRVWIAEKDRVAGLETNEVDVLLHVDPDRTRHAWLDHVSSLASTSPQGVPCFVAEARWAEGDRAALGLGGTAVLYGEETTVAYWLFRKPWTSAREFLGR